MKILTIVLVILAVIIAVYFAYSYFSSKGVGEPSFTVNKQHGAISIRQYSPMLIAEVTTTGNRKQAINSGFRVLANYIFGNNTSSGQDKIAMTAPVMQQSTKIDMTAPVMQQSTKIDMTAPVMQTSSSDGSWNIRFVMPKKFTMDTLPKPNNTAIKILIQPAEQFIVIKFSGLATSDNLQTHQKKLEKYIQEHNIKISGSAVYAFYNPPWTIPFMRRNEIMFKLVDK
jgi:hypothetical protein